MKAYSFHSPDETLRIPAPLGETDVPALLGELELMYASPVRGTWNIVHIGTLLPQSHEVFVCPTSCLRGVVLTTAEMGAMDRLSTITVGEDNLLQGDMEEALQRGVERIIAELPARPRAMLIFTSCIHHFLAVNYQRVYRVLREEYPDIDFIDCYMDPIMRKRTPAVPSLWRQMSRLLPDMEKRRDQVSLVGNCFPYHGDACDLVAYLEREGVTVKDLNTCKSYDEYLSLGASCINFTFHATARTAGKDLRLRLGQEWLPMHSGYFYEGIDRDMEAAARALGLPPLTLEETSSQKRLTEEALIQTLAVLGHTPIAIDSAGVDAPLELALFLGEHGFFVESVFLESLTESPEMLERLRTQNPGLLIYPSLHPGIRRLPRGHEGKVVAIGQKAAYFLDTNYFVDLVENDGMYGYRGIRRLLRLLREAACEEKPMRDLVQQKGWHCGCTF